MGYKSKNDGLLARQCALDIIGDVISRQVPLDDVLDRHADFNNLVGKDRPFCRMLIATVFRRMGQIDDLIRRSLTQKNKKIKPIVLHNLLRLGVAQVAFMNVADHAAVDSCVSLAAKNGCFRQKGFVNAVMRSVLQNHKQWISVQDEGRLNAPEWLLQYWIKDYGLKTAGEIASANLSEACVDLTLKISHQKLEWDKKLGGQSLPNDRVRLPQDKASHIPTLAGFEDGAWWVQDLSASLPVLTFGDVAGATIVDICAAPGGKTAQLADAGANVVAVDRSARRLGRLKENMQRLGLSSKVEDVVADACVWQPSELVDGVLVDVPCSATGTIRRHPDLPYIKNLSDIHSLVTLQADIMDNAKAMLKERGVLLYCTCSLQKDEGERQVEAFLERHVDMERLPIRAEEIGGLSDLITDQGEVRVLPFHMADQGGMDGFFISRLVRR